MSRLMAIFKSHDSVVEFANNIFSDSRRNFLVEESDGQYITMILIGLKLVSWKVVGETFRLFKETSSLVRSLREV